MLYPLLQRTFHESLIRPSSKMYRTMRRGVQLLYAVKANYNYSKAFRSTMAKSLTLDNMNPCIKVMEYAVRGPLVIRAVELEKELQSGASKPFTSVIRANIGDAHAMGQKPITFIRQVIACCQYPKLIESPEFPQDVKDRAKKILSGCGGGSIGAYTSSDGIELIRQDVAAYIKDRDGIEAHPDNILLSGGASEIIANTLKLFIAPNANGKTSGIMVPIPQYPLYSATVAEFGLHQIGYYLDEENNWALDIAELHRALASARSHCQPRVLCVINPGNPTGQVLSRENIEGIIKFAYENELFLFADEVYQLNIYAEGCTFHSFKKVMTEMGAPYSEIELASFHSVSKCYMGECGQRGGYAEILNMDKDVMAMLKKSISAMLCSTATGQAVMDCVVNPPKPGDPSYDLYSEERTEVLSSLAERAKSVEQRFNSIAGIKCNPVQGAMYAFPNVQIPQKAIEKARSMDVEADFFYAQQLLESKGVCIIPGSGFGQKEGTFHFRTTILPQPPLMNEMLDRFEQFHNSFINEYS